MQTAELQTLSGFKRQLSELYNMSLNWCRLGQSRIPSSNVDDLSGKLIGILDLMYVIIYSFIITRNKRGEANDVKSYNIALN